MRVGYRVAAKGGPLTSARFTWTAILSLAAVACERQGDLEQEGLAAFETGSRRVISRPDEFAVPGQMAVVGNHLVVLDTGSDSAVHLVDRVDGELLRSYGHKGGGPGEFRTAWSVDAPPPAEGFWVFDASLSRTTYIDLSRLLLHPDSVVPRILNLRGPAQLMAPMWTSGGSMLSGGFFGEHRLAKLDSAGALVAMVGPPPAGDSLIPTTVRQEIHQGIAVANPSHDRFVLGSSLVPRIEVFDTQGTLLTTAAVPIEWDLRAGDLYSLEHFMFTQDTRYAYMGVAASDPWFFGLFSGRTRRSHPRPERPDFAENVHVFDWSGGFVGNIHLDAEVVSIAVDPEGKTLYVLENDPVPTVSAYLLLGPAARQ